MTTLLWAIPYNTIGLFIVWSTWPMLDVVKHFRVVNAFLMQALWPVYLVGSIIMATILWMMDDDCEWTEFFRRTV